MCSICRIAAIPVLTLVGLLTMPASAQVEPGQTYGAAATRAVQNYIDGKSAWVSVTSVDPSGQGAARIEVRGQDLSEMLLRRGLVWHYVQQAPGDTTLERLEREARSAERGLWSQSSPTPPWEWRSARDSGGR